MMDTATSCRNEQRRDAVRRAQAYGLDYLEVEADHQTLTVTFLGKAPDGLTKDNVRVNGGRRVTDIRPTADPEMHHAEDPEADDWMIVRLDKPGDYSTYTLRLVEAGGDAPPDGFDPRYSSIDFSFMADCPSDLDCKAEQTCPPPARPTPEINYLAKDYGSFRQLIFDRLALVLPDWRERNPADVGVMLVELLAYVGDHLSYYQDAVATEAYLNTSRQRISVRRHARLVDYRIHEGCNARVWVRLDSESELELGRAHGLGFYMMTGAPDPQLAIKPVLRHEELEGLHPSGYEAFEVVEDSIRINPALRLIPFYTWGDSECCIPAGATSATLKGEADALGLKPSDFLLLEEVVGPRTGAAADADPAHRHVVRLTGVTPSEDLLDGTQLVEVEWARQDALPFPLCISTMSGPPRCEPLRCVSVARGNVFLADHGLWREGLSPATVPLRETLQHCESDCEGRGTLTDPEHLPGRFRPRLLYGPLTFSQPVPADAPASGLLRQDPRQCDPALELTDSRGRGWEAQPDLLDSGPEDAHVVVEVGDAAQLRFGDGDLGRAPDPGSNFVARYRVGIGGAGHIGADMLRHVVFREGFADGLTVSNPLAAAGGVEPEPVAEVKQFAPYAFRNQLRRAITPEDYATLAQAPHEPRVQGAEARFLWAGSWYEVLVVIDPFADVPPEEYTALAEEVERHLYRYRRVGHDVRVKVGRTVPVELELEVCVEQGFLSGHVEAALLDAFSNRALPDGRTGFFHADNLRLGQGVALSRIVAAAQAVEGVRSVRVAKLNRKFEPPAGEIGAGFLRVQPWEMPRLDNDPSLPENGTLKLNLRGGR